MAEPAGARATAAALAFAVLASCGVEASRSLDTPTLQDKIMAGPPTTTECPRGFDLVPVLGGAGLPGIALRSADVEVVDARGEASDAARRTQTSFVWCPFSDSENDLDVDVVVAYSPLQVPLGLLVRRVARTVGASSAEGLAFLERVAVTAPERAVTLIRPEGAAANVGLSVEEGAYAAVLVMTNRPHERLAADAALAVADHLVAVEPAAA